MVSSLPADPPSLVEILYKGRVERFGGIDKDIVDIALPAFAFQLLGELMDGSGIRFLYLIRLRHHFLACFHIAEGRIHTKFKIAFAGIEHLEDDDLVSAVAEAFERRYDGRQIVEKVADEIDQSAP